MYQIFESNLYYQRIILEAETPTPTPTPTPTEVETDNEDNSLKKETINKKSVIKKKKPPPIKEDSPSIKKEPLPPMEENIPPMEENIPPTEDDPMLGGEEQLSPEEIEKNNFQAIQKFILYHKLRELQYKLDNVQTINLYKNKEDLIKFNKFLSYVITFFSIFDFKQASKLTERILTEFKKIK